MRRAFVPPDGSVHLQWAVSWAHAWPGKSHAEARVAYSNFMLLSVTFVARLDRRLPSRRRGMRALSSLGRVSGFLLATK